MGENKRKPNSYKSGNSQNKKNTEKTNFDKKYKFEKKDGFDKKKGSVCAVFKKCGGCQYIDKKYEEQLDIKFKYISKLLANYGKVEEIIGMDNPYNYRNKVTATFRHKRNGEIISGIYEEGTHNVLPVTDCRLEDKKAQEIIATIRGLVKSFKITIYNEDSGYGLLRHVMVRTAKNTGQIMVTLVTASPVFPSKKNFSKALVDRHPEITTIIQNINDRTTSMVLGNRNQVLYGRGYIEDILCGKRFKLSPTSFYQVNPIQTEILYNKAMGFAGLTGKETVIDAYCGIGTIGMVATDDAREVIGVELNKEAVRDAISNSKLNGCKNINFYNNDAGKFMVNMANQGEKVDVVFMDPPRSGSDEAFMKSVIKLAPQKIVYISCGPESLARDLKYMTKNGNYKVEKIVAVDMFPWTTHVETVVLMSRGAVRPVDERFARTGAEA